MTADTGAQDFSFAGDQADTGLGRTSLTRMAPKFGRSQEPAAILESENLRVVVVTNSPLGKSHKAGYNGLVSMTHAMQDRNIFVPSYAGLNFELIVNGKLAVGDLLFEPRRSPMELRRIDANTAELYQPPTPYWRLESCTRFHLLPDGVIEMSFECIPRDIRRFPTKNIWLFWASYIDQPKDIGLYFIGRSSQSATDPKGDRIHALSHRHGLDSTHRSAFDQRAFERDPEFPPKFMVFSFSNYRYTEPFYYGHCRNMQLAYIFSKESLMWFSQSPSGGGKGNPAWDFCFFIPQAEQDHAYGFTMRALYVPEVLAENLERMCRRHVNDLDKK